MALLGSYMHLQKFVNVESDVGAYIVVTSPCKSKEVNTILEAVLVDQQYNIFWIPVNSAYCFGFTAIFYIYK